MPIITKNGEELLQGDPPEYSKQFIKDKIDYWKEQVNIKQIDLEKAKIELQNYKDKLKLFKS